MDDEKAAMKKLLEDHDVPEGPQMTILLEYMLQMLQQGITVQST